MRKEERIYEVYKNSKEIQYSDQVSEMGYEMSLMSNPKKSFANCIKDYKIKPIHKHRASIDSYRVPDNKAIPLNMIYMERVMTKLTGSRSKRRRMREQSCQTATQADSHNLDDSDEVLSLNPGEVQELVDKSMKKIIA